VTGWLTGRMGRWLISAYSNVLDPEGRSSNATLVVVVVDDVVISSLKCL